MHWADASGEESSDAASNRKGSMQEAFPKNGDAQLPVPSPCTAALYPTELSAVSGKNRRRSVVINVLERCPAGIQPRKDIVQIGYAAAHGYALPTGASENRDW